MKALCFKKLEMSKILTSKGLSYEILFSIKESPTKQVYKALRKEKETGIEQEVLLKIFSFEEESYKGELESLLQVNSNYCVRLLGFENFPKGKALVLEYIKGVSLSQLIKTFTLSEIEIDILLDSIYEGLVDLKTQNLSHGDLSLDNVLVTQDVQIKFIDFGKGNYGSSSLGTFPFVAPEIVQGSLANFLSDLFSLGVIESVLKQDGQLLNLHKKKAEDFISSTNPLLASDPEKRFFSSNQSTPSNKKAEAVLALSHKIKDFLSSVESKKYETQKIYRSRASFLKTKSVAWKISILLFFGVFAGTSSFSKAGYPTSGFLKVSTNKWFFIQLEDFKSYAPFSLSLSPGWHLLNWENPSKKGRKLIHIKPRQTLLLNDKDF